MGTVGSNIVGSSIVLAAGSLGGGGGPVALFGPDAFENLDAWTLIEQSGDTANISSNAWGMSGQGTAWATIWNDNDLPTAGTKFYAQAAITNPASTSSFTKLALLFGTQATGQIESDGTPSGYLCYYDHSNTTILLRRRAAGAPTTVANPSATFAANDVLRVEVTDNGTSVAFEFFQNGESIGTYTDETPPASRGLNWGFNVQSISSVAARLSAPEMGTA